MPELGSNLNLAPKAIDANARRKLRRQGFDDDIAAEGVVADDEDARHTAPGELADDSVAFTQGVG
jgi:hypothetical protein